MVKKKKRARKKQDFVQKDIHLFQKEINKDVKDVEGWILARRKFFKKLLKVVLLTVILYLLIKLF